MTDPVNHPTHYTSSPSGIECIDVVEHMTFNQGNAMKYLWRCYSKGKPVEDLRKAKWYIEREIAKIERAEAADVEAMTTQELVATCTSGIVFADEAVRAIRDGRKTQFRKPITRVRGLGAVSEFGKSDTPGYDWIMRDRRMLWNDFRNEDFLSRLRYQIGKRYYVKETWAPGMCIGEFGEAELSGSYIYRSACVCGSFKPASIMPRKAARYVIETDSVKVQRLQDITEEDAIAEGFEPEYTPGEMLKSSRLGLARAWDESNGKKFPWASNPWIECYTSHLVQP